MADEACQIQLNEHDVMGFISILILSKPKEMRKLEQIRDWIAQQPQIDKRDAYHSVISGRIYTLFAKKNLVPSTSHYSLMYYCKTNDQMRARNHKHIPRYFKHEYVQYLKSMDIDNRESAAFAEEIETNIETRSKPKKLHPKLQNSQFTYEHLMQCYPTPPVEIRYRQDRYLLSKPQLPQTITQKTDSNPNQSITKGSKQSPNKATEKLPSKYAKGNSCDATNLSHINSKETDFMDKLKNLISEWNANNGMKIKKGMGDRLARWTKTMV